MANYTLVRQPSADPEQDQVGASIEVGASAPRYDAEYLGWVTDIGMVPDPDQAMTIQSDGGVDTPVPPTVSMPAFWNLWHLEEEAEARGMRATNPTLDVLFYRLEDRRTVEVDLNAYQGSIRLLVSQLTCIKTEQKPVRIAQILAGIPV